MKNLIALVFLLSVFGLESTNGQVNLNFAAGINRSNYPYKNFDDLPLNTNSRFGYFIEVTPVMQLREKVRFLSNIQYSLKGFDDVSLSYKLIYIDFIPELEFMLHDNFSFGVGANFATKIFEASKVNNGAWSIPLLNFIKPYDFGLTTNVRFHFKNFFAFFRYNLGLNNNSTLIYTDGNGQIIDKVKQPSRNFQIGLGYRLHLKKQAVTN